MTSDEWTQWVQEMDRRARVEKRRQRTIRTATISATWITAFGCAWLLTKTDIVYQAQMLIGTALGAIAWFASVWVFELTRERR